MIVVVLALKWWLLRLNFQSQSEWCVEHEELRSERDHTIRYRNKAGDIYKQPFFYCLLVVV
jgi:hypothetical protein